MGDSSDAAHSEDKFGVLIHSKKEDLPPNAVLLSPVDVYHLRRRQISSWKNRSDVWPLLYGPTLSAMTVSISSFIANINARQMFHLHGQKFFWSTAMPTIAFPVIAFWAAFEVFITRPILTRPPEALEDDGPCDVCLEIRASITQLFCGSILPGGLAFLSSSLAALTERTYPVPALNNPKILWATFKLYNRNFRITGPVMMLIHTLMGSGLVSLMLQANRNSLVYQNQLEGNVTIHPAIKTN